MARNESESASFNMSVQMTDSGFVLTTDLLGQITKEVVNVRADLKEKALRGYLIAQGWTPPNGEQDEA